MNWFTRIFSRRRDADDTDFYDIPAVDDAVSIASTSAAGIEAAPLPGFAASASRIDHRPMLRDGDERWHAVRRAFTPSQPVQDIRMFAGRSDILRRVIRAIEDQHLHVIVYGDRGIGKTSLMRMVRELAGRAHYVVSYTSCGEDTEFSDTMRAIAARIPLLYHDDYDPTVDEVARGGTLADKLPDGSFTVAQFSDLLANVTGTRVLIILDEFDRTGSDRFRNNIAELIKNLSDRSIRVQLLIGGVASSLSQLIAHVPSIRRNIVGIPVPNMDDEEVRDLVRVGTEAGRIAITAGAVDRIVASSAGLPYLAALIGQHATLHAAEHNAPTIGEANVSEAVLRARDDIGSRLSPEARFALAQPNVNAPDAVIVRAAEEAVRSGGIIRTADIVSALATASPPGLGLTRAVEGDPFGGWQFHEDGVASFVWLSRFDEGD